MQERILRISNESFQSYFGNTLSETFRDKDYGKDNSTVQYVSGIEEIDKFLEGLKFANTDFTLSLSFTNNAMIIWMYGKGGGINVNFYKEEIESVIPYHTQDIEIPDINTTLNILKTGINGGIIQSVAAHATDSLIKKIKPSKTKITKGSIYEFRIKEKGDENKVRLIKLSCREDNKYIINKYIDDHLSFHLSVNDPKERCFITTVCFENPLSDEVITFKRFRDQILKKHFLGRIATNIYYKFSPTFSDYLYDKNSLKRLIKKLFLEPIYYFLKKD